MPETTRRPPEWDLPQRMDHELDVYIDRALDRDPEAAKALLQHFIRAVETGAAVDPKVNAYLAVAFRRMFEAGTVDPRPFLGLLRPRGNPGKRVASDKRPTTEGEADERQQEVYLLVARGWRDTDIIKKQKDEPIVCRHESEATVRARVRKAKRIPAERDGYIAEGMTEYEAVTRVAADHGVPERLVRAIIRARARSDQENDAEIARLTRELAEVSAREQCLLD